MAQLPLPGRPVTDPGLTHGSRFTVRDLPERTGEALARLTDAGHDAALVGGCVRDLVLGGRPDDWDVATSALPEEVSALFPGSSWENRFGTVTLTGDPRVEITTFRAESGYEDARRPSDVRFHRSLEDDLARRDFTINAIAWRAGTRGSNAGTLVDPFGGLEDLREGRLRAVGDPAERVAEDALRILRGIRFAARFRAAVDPATEAAMRAGADRTRSLSGERVRDEILRLLADVAIRPSEAFARWESVGILRLLLPELADLRGVPQGKPAGGDALDHSLRTADELPPRDAVLRLTGLLHDLGKASTGGDGHFIGHETVGAEQAESLLRRLRFGTDQIRRVTHLVRHHMFGYEPAWTDAAVRRFIRRVGANSLDDLFALRAADNAASGVGEPPSGGLDELRRRIAEQLAAPLAPRQLEVDGHDLQRELGMEPGPRLGEVLERLMEAVVEDPALNERETLLRLAAEPSEER